MKKQLFIAVLLGLSNSIALATPGIFTLDCGKNLMVNESIIINTAVKGTYYPISAVANLRGQDKVTGVAKAIEFQMEGDFASGEDTTMPKSFGPAILLSEKGNPAHQLVTQKPTRNGQVIKVVDRVIVDLKNNKIIERKLTCRTTEN